jgi:hypothetical protein
MPGSSPAAISATLQGAVREQEPTHGQEEAGVKTRKGSLE